MTNPLPESENGVVRRTGPGLRRARPARMSGDERERAILEGARRLLARGRLSEISVDDLAAAAGISRPTFYFYFASKEAVLLTLLERMVSDARLARDAALADAGEDPVRGWRAGIQAFHVTWQANRDLIGSAEQARATSSDIAALWRRVIKELVAEAAAGIEAERNRGAAPAGLPAAELAWCLTLMNERVFSATTAEAGLPEARTVDALLSIWLDVIYRGRLEL